MGKNGRFGKLYGKVVGKDSPDRPGWKGPGYVKKAPPKKAVKPEEQEAETIAEPATPAELQQHLLNIFKDSFPTVLLSENLQPLLQEVKAALYERDFQRAFGKQEYLEAYSVRWSPSRALCYQSILVDINEHLSDLFRSHDSESSKSSAANPPHIACLGGNGAELMAISGFLKYLKENELESDTSETDESPAEELRNLSVSKEEVDITDNTGLSLLLLDSAQWQEVVSRLQRGLTTPPTLSKYASAAAKAANNSTFLKPGDITASCSLQDILEMSQDGLANSLGKNPLLVTCLFTLNELYTASIAKTTGFLLKLTTVVKPGTVFLVVDSPGSYSETTIGSESKKYPMSWLLDHCLLTQAPKAKESTSPDWVKIISEDSKWFRVPEVLRYPIPLESMRYQIHLYRRV